MANWGIRSHSRGVDDMEDGMLLDKIYYAVDSLEGDYAYLRKDGDVSDETKCVARALLPPEIAEGSRLVYEMMEYSLSE